MNLPTNSPIINEYRARTPGSAALDQEARQCFPSGITHDSRFTRPYGIFVDKAAGPRKWDVDGNEYVDYFGGHGALLLGHCHPAVEQAVMAMLQAGTHFGASHRHEVEWAEQVKRLVPSAERVRFTSSGTEATHMAFRLARAFTGRSRIVRFRTHFHGWHDHMAFGVANHFDGTPSPGVVPGVAEHVRLVDPGDLDGFLSAIAGDGDVAAAIVEPCGASTGKVPLRPSFLHALREETARHGVLLVFDEVVTGFRVSPGGAQAAFGVTPDLCALAKILAGGLPGGAVAGRADVMEHLDFDSAERRGFEKIAHPGTYNANPVSAVAGKTALSIIGDGDACERANAYGDRLRVGLNQLFRRRGVGWAAYGEFSCFHLFLNPDGDRLDPEAFDPFAYGYQDLKGQPAGLMNKLRLALLARGVDIMGSGSGLASATHGEAEMEATLAAFDDAIDLLRREESVAAL